jgi:hypothetical protein
MKNRHGIEQLVQQQRPANHLYLHDISKTTPSFAIASISRPARPDITKQRRSRQGRKTDGRRQRIDQIGFRRHRFEQSIRVGALSRQPVHIPLKQNSPTTHSQPVTIRPSGSLINEQIKEEVPPAVGQLLGLTPITTGDNIDITGDIPIASRS